MRRTKTVGFEVAGGAAPPAGPLVLHGPTNVAGQVGLIARAQRLCGVNAVAACFDSQLAERADEIIGSDGGGKLGGTKHVRWLEFVRTRYLKASAFHLYFGSSYIGPGLYDVNWLKTAGRRVIMHFLGCDIRDSVREIARSSWSACTECWPPDCSINRLRAIDVALRVADHVFVSTPDLLRVIPTATYLPLAVDPIALSRAEVDAHRRPAWTPASGRPLRIVHAPTDDRKKGTRFVESAIAQLRATGENIELVIVRDVPQDLLWSQVVGADVAIDQLLTGAYGTFGAECMMLGVPTIAWIAEDVVLHYGPDLPILSSGPYDLIELLKGLLSGAHDLASLRKRSIEYAMREHAATAVAAKAAAVYWRQSEVP